MHANPSLALIVCSVAAIIVASALMILGALWGRVRSIPMEETTRRVDNLARRQETIEALLVRLEVHRDEGSASVSSVSVAGTGSDVRRLPTQRTDRAKSHAVGGPTLIVIPSLAVGAPEASAAAATELGRRFGAIWALADSGESPEAIARTTGQPIGQVELILGLRRQLASQSGGRT